MKKFKDTEYGDLTGQITKCGIDADNIKLTSLEGSPEIANRDFYCNNNKLTSLDGAPEIVNGDFNCTDNPNLKDTYDLLNMEIKGKIKVDKGQYIPTEQDKKMFNAIGKDLSKFRKILQLRELTK